MEITDIIGRDKPFEPPFKADKDGTVSDKYDNVVFYMGNFFYLLNFFPDDEVFGVTVVAQHICDLLNREHCEKGDEV